MVTTSYAIALGSNRRHVRYGTPAKVVAAAMHALDGAGITVTARSSVRATPAMGGAGRNFANAAVLARTRLEPPALLDRLQSLEAAFGRRRGRRWGPRVLDLDILFWSGGSFAAPGLNIPHLGLTARDFVLQPLLEIAPRLRHPGLSLGVRHLWTRLHYARPVDRLGRRP